MFGSKGFAPTGRFDVSAALLAAAMSGAARFSAALPAAADGDSAGKSAEKRVRISSESASPMTAVRRPPRVAGLDELSVFVFRGGDGAFALLDAPAKNAATGLVMVESDPCVATPGGAPGGGGGAVATEARDGADCP